MKIIAACLVLLAAPLNSVATDICRKAPFNPELPAGLAGSYEIVGRDPVDGTAYSGHLAISAGSSGYGIARVISGKVTQGTAWIENCGQDNIRLLAARFSSSPDILAICTLGADGDNYYRVTCRTRTSAMSWKGLESWFQSP